MENAYFIEQALFFLVLPSFLKVYDVISCFNNKLITYFVGYLAKEKKI